MSCCVDTGGEKPDSQGHGSSAAAVLSLDLLLHSSPLSFGKTFNSDDFPHSPQDRGQSSATLLEEVLNIDMFHSLHIKQRNLQFSSSLCLLLVFVIVSLNSPVFPNYLSGYLHPGLAF